VIWADLEKDDVEYAIVKAHLCEEEHYFNTLAYFSDKKYHFFSEKTLRSHISLYMGRQNRAKSSK